MLGFPQAWFLVARQAWFYLFSKLELPAKLELAGLVARCGVVLDTLRWTEFIPVTPATS